MEDTEDGKPSNTVTIAAPAADQNGIHVYPDWAAMQAYYGPRLAVPPYINSLATSHTPPPPYMWAPPQSMIPPYGAPYAAFYAHGGVYAHPGVHIGGTALSMDMPAKTFGNSDGNFVKKLKGFDGLAMSIGNGNSNNADNAARHGVMKSEETEGSSDGSKASSNKTTWDVPSDKKRSRQGSPNSGKLFLSSNATHPSKNRGSDKDQKQSSIVPGAAVGQGSEKVKDVIVSAKVESESKVNMSTALELKNPSDSNVSGPRTPTKPLIPSETWLQDERELKRERRKQSNRESARRSRLRKQAEAEELAIKVRALTSENTTLKSELTKLMKNSEKLKLENATIMEKLKDAQKTSDFKLKPVSTVNLLARVNKNSNSTDRNNENGDSLDNTSPGAKLHLLLDTSPRTDAVAAS
ncbi:transcriptional activator TAF-1 [Dorcoceras hygrometricum]|uniref:Transcriptional activator TAF-1 n=1 Tax=Dorcoceras hygrometricum TaxID=472368 RepID=A0A2Z7AJI5_9LAMI|nr:transcriptional activator TAF-1 [Dorcoceras hygrometricum]